MYRYTVTGETHVTTMYTNYYYYQLLLPITYYRALKVLSFSKYCPSHLSLSRSFASF